ncbi:MAG: hypothetical protein ACR2OO_07905 [Thermomicrobiales bacterium]
MDMATLTDLLRAALESALAADEFDILVDDAVGTLDVACDDWTLHLERWPDGTAFLAIDDEPDEPDEPGDFAAARRAVMGDAVERALADVDRALDGALSRALAASGDPFSADLVATFRN